MNLDLMKLLAMKVVKFEGGEITVYDRGMVLVPAEMLIEFYEVLEKKLGSEEAETRMVEIGENLTVKSTKRYMEKKKELRPVFRKLATGDPSIEMGREVFRMSGLGDLRIIEATADSSKFVIGTKSPIAKEYLKTRGKSKGPVCGFLMGIISGVLRGSKGVEYSMKEVRCLATGLSDECCFEFRRV